MINSRELINKVKSYNKFLNPKTLDKAYNFAINAHSNQKRQSGDPYVFHPIAVANILTELKLDSATIATGLLHDNRLIEHLCEGLDRLQAAPEIFPRNNCIALVTYNPSMRIGLPKIPPISKDHILRLGETSCQQTT